MPPGRSALPYDEGLYVHPFLGELVIGSGMSKKQDSNSGGSKGSGPSQGDRPLNFLRESSEWQERLVAVANRFNRELRGEKFSLPEEVEALPIFQEWTTGCLQTRLASPFWELVQPKKNYHCLDLGCGVSFLIYPWRDWNAFFYGQDISVVACDALTMRGPQLNSKLFKGVVVESAHILNYSNQHFDLAIATGFSCYYPLDYWQAVLEAVRPVLKPGASFVFDVLNPESANAENWAILETYLGAEVFLEAIADWEALIKSTGGRIIKRRSGELFDLYQVGF